MRLLHDLILTTALESPDSVALSYRGFASTYGDLATQLAAISGGLISVGLQKGDRVAIYLAKQPEAVVAFFATTLAGGVFVPVNPQLKSAQVGHILTDSGARLLITTAARAKTLRPIMATLKSLKTVIVDDNDDLDFPDSVPWSDLTGSDGQQRDSQENDLAALLYTSGSTGKPKGVMLSHKNLVSGAQSVSGYLQNRPDDKLLAVLPFSFDYGFSQLSTAFYVGAQAVLFDYLLPRDVIRTVSKEKITGLACVPPLWNELSRLQWPDNVSEHLRYITNSGGSLPLTTLKSLKKKLPGTKIYLMYGLTEAFRSTFLDPSELDRRPTSIGKAIPAADIKVLREDGSPCAPYEDGELVHSGPLVALGYWNDKVKTAGRFRPLPDDSSDGQTLAVWSGDTVRFDDEGFLYFVGRHDGMIKTMGYRVSPTEIEEAIFDSGLVSEAIAIGVPHPESGQAVIVIATANGDDLNNDELEKLCRGALPNYMIPAHIEWRRRLPHTPNGKIDRNQLTEEFQRFFTGTST